jgi:hypothetical protein
MKTYTRRYQGLGMANYALVSLALKLSFLQCCNLGFSRTHSTAMMMGYKLFMVKVGLYKLQLQETFNAGNEQYLV